MCFSEPFFPPDTCSLFLYSFNMWEIFLPCPAFASLIEDVVSVLPSCYKNPDHFLLLSQGYITCLLRDSQISLHSAVISLWIVRNPISLFN